MLTYGGVTYIWPATHEPLKSPFNIIVVSVNIFSNIIVNIRGHTFSTAQSLAAHVDSEHPEAEQPEIF